MGTTFEIRQRVSTVKTNRFEVVESWNQDGERVARNWFRELKENHPDAYLELVKVTHNEECLEFTAFR